MGQRNRVAGEAGFTLVELLVVVTLIGVLTAIGIPQYLSTMESSRADDAVATVKMIATAERMYNLDKKTWPDGTVSNGATCSGSSTAADLVGCGYLASQDWTNRPYIYKVGPTACGAGTIACASRRTSGTGSTSTSPYSGWGYTVDGNGAATAVGGAPAAAN